MRVFAFYWSLDADYRELWMDDGRRPICDTLLVLKRYSMCNINYVDF